MLYPIKLLKPTRRLKRSNATKVVGKSFLFPIPHLPIPFEMANKKEGNIKKINKKMKISQIMGHIYL
jgi:hypothetical protein